MRPYNPHFIKQIHEVERDDVLQHLANKDQPLSLAELLILLAIAGVGLVAAAAVAFLLMKGMF